MQEYMLLTDRGNLIQTVHWLPECESTHVVLIVHSYGDTCSRYEWLARYLTSNNFHVITFDLNAHGRSGGLRSKWRSLDDLQQDLSDVLKHYHNELPTKNWYGLGMGFGATLLSLSELDSTEYSFKGLALWSPLIKLSTRFPKVILDSIKYVNSFTSHLNVLTLQATLLTNNPENLYSAIPDWEEDYGKISAKTAGIMIDSGSMMMKNWEQIKVPIWVGWGEGDRFVDINWLKGKESNKEQTNRVYKEFLDATHFLEQDELGLHIAQEIETWLKLILTPSNLNPEFV